MRWSLRIARVSGIDIKVHASFLLVVLYFAAVFGGPHGARGAAFGALLVTLLFACVVLHELGHSLVAQRFGVGVREIVLLPIGGLARLEREPSRPVHELLIAIAGPLVNVVIAAALGGAVVATLGAGALFDGGLLQSVAPPSLRGLLGALVWANVGLAVFNMIPALPMDGGRVFRAVLAMMMQRTRATRIAATVGQLLAASVGLVGIFYLHDVWLAMIGAFVFLGASQERAMATAHDALSGLTAGDICDPDATVLAPGEQLGAVIDHLLRAPRSQFAVMHGEQLVGMLSRDELLEKVGSAGLGAFVASIMQREVPVVDATTPLEKLRVHLASLPGHTVAVFGPHGYVGLLGLDDVARIASLITALQRRGVMRPVPAPREAPFV